MILIPALVLLLLTKLSSPVHAQEGTALLTLESSTTTPQTGQSFTITIAEAVASPTIGTDVVLIYDPTALKYESTTEGDVYGQYPNIETAGSTPGVVRISGIPSDITEPAAAEGTFATVTFTPQNPGNTTISIDYATGDTTKSGIIPAEGSLDNLLTAAPEPLNLTVSGKALAPAPAKTTKTGAIDAKKTTQTDSNLPLTLGIITGGVLLTALTVFFLIKRHGNVPPKNPPFTPPQTPPSPQPSTPQPTPPASTITTPPVSVMRPSVTPPPTPAPVPSSNPSPQKNPEDALYGVSVPGAQPVPAIPVKPIAPPPQQPLTATPTPPPLPSNHQNIDSLLQQTQANTPPVGPNPEDALRA